MRIGLFTDTYPPHINGVATSVCMLKKALEKTGLPANVICDEHGLAACLTAPDKTAEALRTVYKALE